MTQSDQRQDVEQVAYDFGDQAYILTLLARLSVSILDYIREAVDNSIDSIADVEPPLASYLIQVVLDRRANRILVSDNAQGMNRDGLRSIVQSIGLSQKRLSGGRVSSQKIRRGMHAVGIHGWEIMGKTCFITTRRRGGDKTFSLLMGRDAQGTRQVPEIALEPTPRSDFGTDVEVSDISAEKIGRLSAKRVVDFLAKEYRIELLDTTVPLEMQVVEVNQLGKRTTHYVSPVRVVGKPFTLANGETTKYVRCSNGRTHTVEKFTFSGVGFPNRTDGGIRIRHGSRRVYKDITDIEGFDTFPWNTGRFDLDIQASFCVLDPSKKLFVDDDDGKFEGLKKALHEIEPDLIRFLEELDQGKKKEGDNSSRAARDLVVGVFAELGYEFDGLPMQRRANLSGKDEINVDLVAGTNGSAPKSHGGTSRPGRVPPPPTLGSNTPVDPSKPRRPAVVRPQFDVYPQPLEDLAVRAIPQIDQNGRLVAVIINSSHPNYKTLVEKTPNSVEAKRYRVDQLVAVLVAFHLGSEQTSVSEIMGLVGDVRYLAFSRGGLLITK